MPRGMAGTLRGATPCAGCGHTRGRHTDRGRGPCAQAVPNPDLGLWPGDGGFSRCTCQSFIAKRGE